MSYGPPPGVGAPSSGGAPGARPGAHGAPSTEVSLSPAEGWHCTHSFYRFDRAALKGLTSAELAEGQKVFAEVLNPEASEQATRVQTSLVAGHRADFALMILDPCPLKVDSVHQRLMASPLGTAIVPTYSFVSLTEVSEYVPSVEQYGKRLVEEGEDPNGPAYAAKLKAYESREVMMRKQRLTPDMPPWPNTCFYPMNKKRETAENWFLLHFEERNRLMAEHGRSGMKFGGKVTQLITVSVGLDDWEWGVTLWARNPAFLKEIVYTMRFDEASARFAEFGPFYTSYVTTPQKVLEHCRVAAS
ncbi:MAG: heme-dependent peroxidase [Planctomycetales bacterium]|nr:heme-dependent peroxidase [Planctomycetales bacterium]MBN8626070.1 heme-dependent peroxidase [Planctomycetota bacterium]